MLPSPTAEALLIVGLISAIAGGKPSRCRKISHGVVARLNAPGSRRLRELREALPAMEAARTGAVAILRTRCAVCPSRHKCKAPLHMA